jgi:hypothetical protein
MELRGGRGSPQKVRKLTPKVAQTISSASTSIPIMLSSMKLERGKKYWKETAQNVEEEKV